MNPASTVTETSQDYLPLLNSLPQGFALHEVLFNPDGKPYDYRFLMVNPAFEKITGLAAGKVMGKTVRQILPHIEQKWMDFYGRVVITGCAFEFEEFNADLSKHFHVYAYRPSPKQFAVIFYDITREVTHGTSLAYSARSFQQLFDLAPVVMLCVDESGKIQNVNQSFLERTGWLRVQLIGKHITTIVDPIGNHVKKQPDEISFWAQTETSHLPCKLKLGNAHFAKFLLDCRRTRDPQGKILSICVFQDLDPTANLGGILEESEERFRSAFENSGIGMALVSPNGHFLQINRAFCRIVGYGVDEILAMTFQQITCEEDVQEDMEHVRRMLRNEIDTYSMEKRYIHKNGHLVWVILTVTSVHDETGHVKYFVSQMQEITDRKNSEVELLRAKEAAEAGSRAKSSFLAQMSHEIRTPMNSIIAPANMLLEAPMEENPRELVEMIQKSAEHLMGVINDILDYSKIEANKVELEVVPFHLLELIQDVIDQANLMARMKNLSVESYVEEKTPILWNGDPSRIRQILLNLVNNSIKFTEKGLVRIHAGLRENENAADQPYLYFAVEDTGIGITKEQRDRLFEAFQQANPTIHRQYGGTGLGLVICQKLVCLMDGSIELLSDIGKGTQVKILIPCTIIEDGDLLLHRHNENEKKLPDLSHYKILVADDNIPNQKIIAQMLRRLGCVSTVAGNGREALDLYHRFEFDLILMDCEMPVMGGFETTQKIREAEKNRRQHIPIVAITAHASMATNQQCFACGMDDYMSKPINLYALAGLLERWLLKKSST